MAIFNFYKIISKIFKQILLKYYFKLYLNIIRIIKN